MPEQKQVRTEILKLLGASAECKKQRHIADTAHYILREWIALTVGAPPEFATDNASAAMAVAKMYVEACEATVSEESEPETSE